MALLRKTLESATYGDNTRFAYPPAWAMQFVCDPERGAITFYYYSSIDPNINIWDLRNTSKPVGQLIGHHHPTLTRSRSIYHPNFVANGNAIVTTGDKSNYLTLYDYKEQNIISKGLLVCLT